MKDLSSNEIASLLAPYYPAEKRLPTEKISAYIALLSAWNRKISLTAITDPIEVVKFHFGESLLAASTLKMRNGRLADVGSGAGFPGIPIAMAIPGVLATLIESNTKKVAFLSEVVRRLEIPNVTVIRNRMEDIKGVEALDFVCARAVGHHVKVIQWSRENLKPKGKLVLFLSDEDALEIRKDGDWDWEQPTRIPGSSRRCILSGVVAQ